MAMILNDVVVRAWRDIIRNPDCRQTLQSEQDFVEEFPAMDAFEGVSEVLSSTSTEDVSLTLPALPSRLVVELEVLLRLGGPVIGLHRNVSR